MQIRCSRTGDRQKPELRTLVMALRNLRRRPAVSSLAPLSIGTPQQFGWLHGIVKAVVVLNLLDAVFTLWWVRLGLAEEANALLRDLVSERPLMFMLVKIILVSLGAMFLWLRRRQAFAVIAIFAVFFIYYLVLLHHLRHSTIFFAALFGV